MGGFTRFVQVGRVCAVNYGEDNGKLAVILEVLDANRVLVQGPKGGLPRQVINLKRVSLTDIHLKAVNRGMREKLLDKAIKEAKVDEQWAKTSSAKRAALRAKRANSTDFDRFKLMIAKKRRSAVVRAEFNKVRKAARK